MIKIRNAYIDGYGKFQDKKFDFETAQFVLITGDNESGKSTVFNFLRSLLSGFNNFRSKENHYFPLNGGKHGGRVCIENNVGSFEFERYGNTKELSAIESSKDSDILLQQLERIQLADYRALFAFDLDELRQLSLLEKDELTEKLFSTGLSGANSLITNGMKDLRDRSLELFRPRSGSALQEAYNDYLSMQEHNSKLKNDLAEYQMVLAEIKNLNLQLGDNEEELLVFKKKLELINHQLKKNEFIKRKNKYDADILEISSNKIPDKSIVERESYLFTKNLELLEELRKEENTTINYSIADLQKELDLCNLAIETTSLLTEVSKHLENLKIKESGQTKNLLIIVLIFLVCSIGINLFVLPNIVTTILVSLLIVAPVAFLQLLGMKSIKKDIQLTIDQIEGIVAKQNEYSELIDVNVFSENALEAHQLLIRDNIKIAKDHSGRLNAIRKEIALIEQEVANIYSGINVHERSQFLKVLEYKKQLSVLTQQKDDFINFVRAQGYELGESEVPTDLSESNEDISSKITDLENTNKFLRTNLAKIEVKRENLLHSTKYEENALEVSAAFDRANDLYSTWQSTIVAESILKEVLSLLYISKYKSVLESSSKIIEQITLGEYTKVKLGQNESELILVGRSGKQFQVQELSRGTIEQLYLSMRIALAISYGEKFGKVPLIFDDVIVNFHYERAKEALKILKQISSTHQVIFFTCHKWIREIFESISDETMKIIEIA